METELWPNTIAACKQENVKILLANARLSERSAAGYRRISGLARQMLMAIDLIAAQAQADADRLIALGAEASKVEVTGSLKFYVDVDTTLSHNDEPFSSIKASGRTVIVIASTRESEESKVLDAILPLLDAVEAPLFILIPRHPERFQEVVELCQKRGLRLQRRSSGQALAADTQVLLGDSMGEMMAYYSLGDIAFVGGSLVDTGCQNVLEPAAWALPVLVGPSQFNFAKICSQMESANALRTVQDATELSTQLRQLLDEPAKREAMGQSGAALVKANRSALPELLAKIDRLLA
jgi:3-deoxy-D-manno-octulosonic-acid transferase